MEVTEAIVAGIPVGNLKVPRAEFTALWGAAERQCAEQAGRGVTDWYAAGVIITCRWLAAVPTPGVRLGFHSPVTRRDARAYEELIEAECLAAELLLQRRPPAAVTINRPGWVEAIAATLRWARRQTAMAPLPVEARTA